MSDLNEYQIIKVGDLPVANTLEGLNILGFDSTNNRAVRALMALLKGLDGKPVELQKTATHLQWRVEGGTWTNLLALDEIKGAPGDNISLQKTATHIQWKLGAGTWVDLVALSNIQGDTGANIELQKSPTHVQWRVAGTSTWNNLILIEDLKVKGDKGDPNTLSIGTVQGGASAGASITGTAPNQTLNLTLPKGDTGSNIELQKTTTHVQWRVVGGTWANLIPLADLKGDKGDNISLQKTATHIQWRLGTGVWTNLVPLSELKGDTGANIELQKSPTHVQWRVQGTTTWNNLILIDDLKVKGDTGANIELQKSATHVQWKVAGSPTWNNLVALWELKGEKGDAPVKDVDYFDGKDPVLNIGTITTVASNAQADATVVADGVDAEGKPKFKLNLWLPKGVDGEGAGDMLKSVYDSDGDGIVDNAEKVNGFTVGTNVPANAKFTDTIYTHPTSDGNLHVPATGTTNNGKVLKAGATAGSLVWGTDNDTITTINGKTGVITKADIVALGIPAQDTVYTHPAGTNPHGTTKADIGLGNVDNTSDADKPVSTAQATAINAKYTKPALGIPKTDLVTNVQTSLGKADTALQSFTETDPTVPSWAKQTNKPTYTATEVGAIPFSEKGANGGVAELDSTGKVLSSQLPSYVDDVLEYATSTNFPTTGETGKIYIAINTNLTYRWTGTAYTEVSPSIALGETSATAYRGDRGKIAYDHSQTAHAPSNAQKNSDITKAEIEAKLTGAITTHTHSQYIESSKFQVVESLPASPVSGTFYFVKE